MENWKVKSRALQSSALGWVWGAGQPGAPPLMGSAIKYLFSQYIQEYISPLFDPTTGVSLKKKVVGQLFVTLSIDVPADLEKTVMGFYNDQRYQRGNKIR